MSHATRYLVAGLLCTSLVLNWQSRPEFTHAASVHAAASAANPFDDQFNTAPLNMKKWQWKHSVPDYSLTARSGFLRIQTKSGQDLSKAVTTAPLLLETAPTGDFEVSTYVEILPTLDFEQAGIVIYHDDQSFCKLVHVHHGVTEIVLGRQKPGMKGKPVDYQFKFLAVPASPRAPGYYLQLDKKGTTYTGYQSMDGRTWHPVASYSDCPAAPTAIGLFATNGKMSKAKPIPADFDFIQARPLTAGIVTPLPIVK
jgi:beta-xylosidase